MFPFGEDFVAIVSIRADAQRAAEVIHNDGGVGEFAGEFGQVGNLGVIQPGVEAEPEGTELCKAFLEFGIGVEVFELVVLL